MITVVLLISIFMQLGGEPQIYVMDEFPTMEACVEATKAVVVDTPKPGWAAGYGCTVMNFNPPAK